MSKFRFKPESILDFYCYGFTSSDDPVTNFLKYLNATGIKTDDKGFLDTEQFLVTDELTQSARQDISQQHITKYKNGTKNLYNGMLYDNFSQYTPTLGYVVLPFKVGGEHVKLVLPGTVLTLRPSRSEQFSSGSGTIVRTAERLSITSTEKGSTAMSAQTFANGVVPLFMLVHLTGGGGGGSSSEGLTAGRGGGGGGSCFAIVPLTGDYTFSIGNGGRGGYHTEGEDSGTSNHHDGVDGEDTKLSSGGIVALIAHGGSGGVAGGSSAAPGGSASIGGAYWELYIKGSSVEQYYQTGGKGAVDSNTIGNTLTCFDLSPFSAGKESMFIEAYLKLAGTHSSGATWDVGGAGGGASMWTMGGAGGALAAEGGSGSLGSGGGGGGYHVGMWIDGGKGGNGFLNIEF